MADWDDIEERPRRARRKSAAKERFEYSFYWQAATGSLVAPLVAFGATVAFQPLIQQTPAAAVVLGFLVLSLIVGGFGLGIAAMFAPPRDRHPLLYLQAIPGLFICGACCLCLSGAFFVGFGAAREAAQKAAERAEQARQADMTGNKSGPIVVTPPATPTATATPKPLPGSPPVAVAPPVKPSPPSAAQGNPPPTAPATSGGGPIVPVPTSAPVPPPIVIGSNPATPPVPPAEMPRKSGGPTNLPPVIPLPPNVGPQTARIGKSTAVELPAVGGTRGQTFRQERAGKPVLGFIHRSGPVGGRTAVLGLTALFSENDATFGQQRTFAKPGYVVGGLNVEADQLVTAVQVVFVRLKTDGTLDGTDSYTSDWIGQPSGRPPTALDGQGKKVLGLHGRRGHTMDAIGLLVEP